MSNILNLKTGEPFDPLPRLHHRPESSLAVSSSEHSQRSRGMLLAARNFYIGGAKLPYDYKVKWIFCKGKSFEYDYEPCDRCEIQQIYLKNASFSQVGGYSGNDPWWGVSKNSSVFHISGRKSYNISSFSDDEMFKIVSYSDARNYFFTSIYDESGNALISDYMFPSPRTWNYIYLLSYQKNATPFSGYLSTFRRLSANGEMLVDAFTVVKDGVGCLYDSVSGTFNFGNGGSVYELGPRV